MLSNLYLLAGFNNYLNRTIKYHDNLNEYAEYDTIILPGINFNPNDEVTTEQILNVGDANTFDYLVVEGQDDGQIKSRWFVIDKTRVRSGQWKVTLRRDVVVDYWNVIKSSPCFIEKAMLNFNDPRIFNSEDMTFNQIKTSEALLKDQSGCAWIVGYYAKDKSVKGDNDSNVGTITTNSPLKIPFVQLDSTLEEWKFYKYTTLAPDHIYDPFEIFDNYQYVYRIKDNSSAYYHWQITIDKNGNSSFKHISGSDSPYSLRGVKGLSLGEVTNGLQTAAFEIGFNSIESIAPNYLPRDEITKKELLNLQGKAIRTIDGKVYKTNVYSAYKEDVDYDVTSQNSLFYAMSNFADKAVQNGILEGSVNLKTCSLRGNRSMYLIELKELEFEELTYDMATNTKLVTTDAPYNIFAIPYGEIDVYTLSPGQGEQTLCKTNAEIAINTAMAIQKNNPGIVYDIQILPYCPMQGVFLEGLEKEIYLTSPDQYSTIKQGDTIKGVILNIPSSRFEFNIIHNIQTARSAMERKVNNQCDKWRLASPNYSNYFDFSVEMNNGVEYFNVDCEYKPYSPYIHINPNFKGMYGQDFNDPRGLVCGGDFSIAAIIDQWQQYQIQNKNFQTIFDRQIQNMEKNNSVQRGLDIANAIAGTVQGTVSGMAAGHMITSGSPFGTAIGGIGGGLSTGIAGVADVFLNEMLRNEAIDFTKDNFGYQLGNIQALPNTLSRISAFNNNNKLFPVLEYYTATEIEKEALRNKIKYNGMTVMTIGKIEDYITYDESYIKGKIIKMPEINDDFHIANSIVNEINQGLYVQGGL